MMDTNKPADNKTPVATTGDKAEEKPATPATEAKVEEVKAVAK